MFSTGVLNEVARIQYMGNKAMKSTMAIAKGKRGDFLEVTKDAMSGLTFPEHLAQVENREQDYRQKRHCRSGGGSPQLEILEGFPVDEK